MLNLWSQSGRESGLGSSLVTSGVGYQTQEKDGQVNAGILFGDIHKDGELCIKVLQHVQGKSGLESGELTVWTVVGADGCTIGEKLPLHCQQRR